jgi:hypothetical protein
MDGDPEYPATNAVLASIPATLINVIDVGIVLLLTFCQYVPVLVVLSITPDAPHIHAVVLLTDDTDLRAVVTGDVCSDHCAFNTGTQSNKTNKKIFFITFSI